MRVTNGIPLESPFILPVHTVNCIQPWKAMLSNVLQFIYGLTLTLTLTLKVLPNVLQFMHGLEESILLRYVMYKR
jgi:hypothetical protein